jgi:hypothetical protein
VRGAFLSLLLASITLLMKHSTCVWACLSDSDATSCF